MSALVQPVNELRDFALHLAALGSSERDIQRSLLTRGLGPGMAYQMAKEAMKRYARQGRVSAAKRICVAALACIASCIATVAHQQLEMGIAMSVVATAAAVMAVVELMTGLVQLVRSG
jgi:hypothetical protein